MVRSPTGGETGGMKPPCKSPVFIVDDSPAIRARLAELLAPIEALGIVGEADNPRDAVAGILRTRPQSVLLDVRLAGRSGLDVMRSIREHAPEVVFVVLTNHSEPQYRRACRDAGAAYFLDKSRDFTRVPQVLAEIASRVP